MTLSGGRVGERAGAVTRASGKSVPRAVVELAELVVERADRLLGRRDHAAVDGRRHSRRPRPAGRPLTRASSVQRSSPLPPRAPLTSETWISTSVIRPSKRASRCRTCSSSRASRVAVAVDLVVGIDLDEHIHSPSSPPVNASRSRTFPESGRLRSIVTLNCRVHCRLKGNWMLASARMTTTAHSTPLPRLHSPASPMSMAKPRKRYVCQACGSVSSRWQGQCADCSEWNSLVEDSGAVVTPFSARHNLRSGGRPFELVGLDAEVALPERMSSGIARVRPRGGRRPGRRLGHPDRRRSRHRQIDPAAAGRRADRVARPAGRLYFRRGGDRPGAAARPPARPRRGAGPARRRDLGPRHIDHPRRGRAAGPGRDRFDPDHAFGPDRGRARARSARSAPRPAS